MINGKTYYIAGYHRFIFCHHQDEDHLIFGGLCEFVKDAATNLMRQKITKTSFGNLKFIEIDIDNIHQYPFIEIDEKLPSYRVTNAPQKTGNYINGAIEMPMKEQKNTCCT